MFRQTKIFIAGATAGALAAASLGAFAFSGERSLGAMYNNIRIFIEGREISPTDANGSAVEPFIVNGTTYLPVRAVGEALGKEVYWDGPNWSVYLGNMGGQLEYPTAKLHELTNITPIDHFYYVSEAVKDNYGNSYGSSYSTFTCYETLLNMKYSRFKATLFVHEGKTHDADGSYRIQWDKSEPTYDDGGTLKIELDGKTIYSAPLGKKTDAPFKVDIPVSGGNHFQISGGGYYMMSGDDAGFYQ
jgi:hypothetical protein